MEAVMIRKLALEDLEEVMSIWLQTNLETHDFIEANYWRDNFEVVKEVLPQAEVYVDEEDGKIRGFIGITQGYIAGIFVSGDYQAKGIGSQLLDKAKTLYPSLTLSVYAKNDRAVSFYLQKGFKIIKEQKDESTNEQEYVMQY